MKLSLFFVAMALACGNATSNEPTTNAGTQSQTNTTGATVQQRGTKSGDYNQTNVGKGIPGAGNDRSAAPPPGNINPTPHFVSPQAPAPPNTGDPPPNDRR